MTVKQKNVLPNGNNNLDTIKLNKYYLNISYLNLNMIYNQQESKDIIQRLKECPTYKEIKELVDDVLPTWITLILYDYSSDYPHLINNWNRLCTITNSTKKQILIVNSTDPNNTITSSFSEVLTCMGFIIRTNEEYIECIYCKKALPSVSTYNIMKTSSILIPFEWSNKCTNCL